MKQPTVSDLIKELKKMPQDALVFVRPHDYEDGYADPASSITYWGDHEKTEKTESNEPDNLYGTHSVIISQHKNKLEDKTMDYTMSNTQETPVQMYRRMCFEFDDICTREGYHNWLNWLVAKGTLMKEIALSQHNKW